MLWRNYKIEQQQRLIGSEIVNIYPVAFPTSNLLVLDARGSRSRSPLIEPQFSGEFGRLRNLTGWQAHPSTHRSAVLRTSSRTRRVQPTN